MDVGGQVSKKDGVPADLENEVGSRRAAHELVKVGAEKNGKGSHGKRQHERV